MVNEELVGGLKSSLERGYSLEQSMLTLLNSGYKREEIKEAARSLGDFKPEQIQPPTKITPIETPQESKILPPTKIIQKITEIKPAQKIPPIITSKTLQIPVIPIPSIPSPIARTKSLQGLQEALDRGYSLKTAMLTLFNAGYGRREIEDAARTLSDFKLGNIVLPKKAIAEIKEIKPARKIFKFLKKEKSSSELPSVPIMPSQMSASTRLKLKNLVETIQKPQIQKVSNYEKPKIKKSPRKTGVIIILIFLLILLIGSLGAILVFRQQLVDFLNSIFG